MSKVIIGNTVGTTMKPQAVIDKTTQAKQIEQNTQAISSLTPMLNMNGCIVCNGEEITLTVGKDVAVGQVITFKYKQSEGYTIRGVGAEQSYDYFMSPVQHTTKEYSDDSVTIENGCNTYTFKGAYFVVIPIGDTPSIDTYSREEIDNMLGTYITEVAELIGGDA